MININHEEFEISKELAILMTDIDKMDLAYANTVTDEIFKKQPFMLSMMLGYHLDTTPIELEEILKIYFLIWEYFKKYKKQDTKNITKKQYLKIETRHIKMLQYLEGETDEKGKKDIYANDIQNMQSKALLTAVIFRFNERPVMLKMSLRMRGIIFIGIKSCIECFEKN